MKLPMIVGLALALFCGPLSAQAETLRIQTVFSPSSTQLRALEAMAENIKTHSEGALSLELFPVNSVVGVTGTLDAVKVGAVDGHVTWPGFWGGGEPAFLIAGDLSGAYRSAEEQMESMQYFGGLDLLRKLYAEQGLHTVGLLYAGHESLASRVPINGIANLEGLKIRVPPGIASNVFSALGAVPVNLPIVEAFGALDKGIVDAADNQTLTANIQQGMHDVAKYALHPSPHANVLFDMSINQGKWDSLSPALQRLLELELQNTALLMIHMTRAEDAASAASLDEHGITRITWSEKDVAAYRSAARKIWTKLGGASPAAQKMLDAQLDYLKANGRLD